MTWMWDCECIELAFDPAYDVGGESADLLFSRARRRTPGHLDEDGFVDRPGGRALRCDCYGSFSPRLGRARSRVYLRARG